MSKVLAQAWKTARAAFAAAAALALLAVPATAQGPPRTGSGSGVVTDVQETTPRTPLGNSGNFTQTRTLTGFIDEGPLHGDFEQVVTGVVRTGKNFVTLHGTLTFTGTVDGCGEEAVTLTLGVTGRGQANPPVTQAQVHVIGTDGGASEVTGRGTVTQVPVQNPVPGVAVSVLEYDIRYICH